MTLTNTSSQVLSENVNCNIKHLRNILQMHQLAR